MRWVCLAYCCLHLLAHVSARWFETTPGVSVWYPSAGLALALLIMVGPRYAPVVLFANTAVALLSLGGRDLWTAFAFPALITANYAAAAYLMRRYRGHGELPESGSGTLGFIAVALLSPFGVALIGTAIALWSADFTQPQFLRTFAYWWLGDAIGIITVVPVLLVFVAPWLKGKPHPLQRVPWTPGFLLLVSTQLLALTGSLWFVFTQSSLPHSTLYLCFLPLVWISLRHGIPGAAVAALILVCGSLLGMRKSPLTDEYLVSYTLFVLVISAVGLGLGSAVTRRNQIRRELHASRSRFDRVIAGAHAGLWDWNIPAGTVVFNRRCAQMLQREPDSLGNTWEVWENAVHTSDRARYRAAMDSHLRGESALYECEYRVQASSGRWRWIHSRGSAVQHDGEGKPAIVSGTFVDVTDRKLTEAAARRLHTILESTTDFVLTIDPHGRVVHANASMLRLLNVHDLALIQDRAFTSAFPQESADQVQSIVVPTTLAKGSWHGELNLGSHTGETVPVSTVTLVHRESDADDSGALLSFVMRDISGQKRHEAETLDRERRYLQVQKAESLNVLAGGIAHDFNNLLTAILGNASLIIDELPPHDRNRNRLKQIELATHRAAELCTNLLVFAGKFRIRPVLLNLNAVVRESCGLMQPAINKKIGIQLHLADSLPPVKASASQLQQVIINFILNAQDAIGDRPGTILFKTGTCEITADTVPAALHGARLVPGPYVTLEVRDSGCGIPEDLREKIFEPFFTTKSTGHGLGLSAAIGIVRAHHGIIEIESRENQGSTFRIYLPALIDAGPDAEPNPGDNGHWQGAGLALVVDDEEMVLTVTAQMIERYGFKTVIAKDGFEAVQIYETRHQELAFVLTDLAMPRMSGDEAIAKMRKINASVPIMLMSGYPEKMTPDHFAMANPSALLAKPIRPEVLSHAIRQVLANKPAKN